MEPSPSDNECEAPHLRRRGILPWELCCVGNSFLCSCVSASPTPSSPGLADSLAVSPSISRYLPVSPRISSHLLASPRISPYLLSPGISRYLPVSRDIPPYPAADTAKRIGQTRDRYRRAAVPPLLSYSLPLPPCRLSRRPMPCLPSVAAAPPYRRPLPPPYRRSHSAAPPPTRTHLTSCSTEFAMRSDPSRRVPRSGLAGPEEPVRECSAANLAEPERRLARWGASMRPTQVVVLLLQASA